MREALLSGPGPFDHGVGLHPPFLMLLHVSQQKCDRKSPNEAPKNTITTTSLRARIIEEPLTWPMSKPLSALRPLLNLYDYCMFNRTAVTIIR